MVLGRNPIARKIVARAGGSHRRPRKNQHSGSPRNQPLDVLYKAYLALGKQLLCTEQNAKSMPAGALCSEDATNTILQPALDALSANRITPLDSTIGSFLKVSPFTLSEVRKILFFKGKPSVPATKVAGFIRGLKQ